MGRGQVVEKEKPVFQACLDNTEKENLNLEMEVSRLNNN